MSRKQMLAALGVAAACVGFTHAQAQAQDQEQPKQEKQQKKDKEKTESQAKAKKGPGMEVQRLESAEKAPFGRYLTDSKGRALYMFEADKKGEPSTCYDACAQAWPPALAGAGQVGLGENLDKAKLGTVARRDGTKQLTYGGWPLYYFAKDTGPGMVTGQDVNGFGGDWYLLAPTGNTITTEPPKK